MILKFIFSDLPTFLMMAVTASVMSFISPFLSNRQDTGEGEEEGTCY